jgi:Flp pilus assembly CpaE family ATPase
VRAVLRQHAPAADQGVPAAGRCLGFIGAKGGVGNTTAVVNTALAFQ